jgi:hypothetical protein
MTEEKKQSKIRNYVIPTLRFLDRYKELIITILFGLWGIHLTNKSNELNTRMLLLSEDQAKTSLDIQHFNKLLVKTDSILSKQSELATVSHTQADSLSVITKHIGRTVDLARDQYNMNLDLALEEYRESAAKFCLSYNDLIFSFVEMEPILGYHRAKRDGKYQKLITRDVRERIKALDKIQNTLMGMGNISDMFPGTKFGVLHTECLNNIIEYRLNSLQYITLAQSNIDTSIEGQTMYDTTMYSVLNFIEAVEPHIEKYRAKAQKRLDGIIANIEVNNKLKAEDKRGQKN